MAQHTVTSEIDGRQYSLETGKLAKFANGSVMIRCEDTMVLVTATASSRESVDIDYLPLQVEYREKLAAAGKYPGGFLKREGRPSDHEILTARLIDRPIRPMIPKTWNYETQLIAGVYSFDPQADPDTLAAVAASAALLISDIPFSGPISEVRVGRVDGEFVLNPSHEQLKESDIDMTVAGTDTSITMVEGESKEISEEEFLEALNFGHEKIRELNKLQMELAALLEIEKREFRAEYLPEEIAEFVKETVYDDVLEYIHKDTTKKERSAYRKTIADKAVEAVAEKFGENEEYEDVNLEKLTAELFSKIEKQEMRKMIIEESRRLDGRELTEIRPIVCETGLLPRAHGSALFTRGETQSLTTTTLGTKNDEQMVDGLLPTYTNQFYLHYNFPPFCTGEVKRMGVSRREVGHGHLAERSLKQMLPSAEEFPYTVRVVSDILESNGSSSMATVCAGSLSLFDAGVPMKKPVAGIAMGLIKEEENIAILSDILGDEDFLGDMDFKVTGTEEGILACQMDIKIEGLSIDIMTKALDQAKAGRMHLLGIMNEALDKPKDDVSQYAPRFTVMKVPQDCIGLIIGPGGETIRGICKDTNTEVNIEDDGTVVIASTSQAEGESAKKMIDQLLAKPEEGEVYVGKIKEVREGLGAIVEFMPKKQGLLHISQISYERVENVSDVYKAGDEVEVKLMEVTRDGKFRLSRKVLLPKPEGYEERQQERRQSGDYNRNGGNRRDGRDNRDGHRNSRGGNRNSGGGRRDHR